jgi:uncharacterized protein with FMN-binding domain
MRRTTAAALSAAALVLPGANAVAAATTQKPAARTKVVVATKTFTGDPGFAGRWGDVQVALTVRKTTTTNAATRKKTVTRKITAVNVPVYPDHTDRSVFINQQALPILIQETMQAQSSTVDMVSGATDTSDGFSQSLQSAILQAKAW